MKQNLIYSGDIKFSGESTTEIVTLTEAKNYIRVSADITDDDDLITSIIAGARQMIENYCGVSLIARTVEVRLLNQLNDIELPFGPVDEFTVLNDVTGEEIDAASYTIDGVLWKTLNSPFNTEVTATYTTSPLNSDEWKNYLLQQVSFMYDHRGDDKDFDLSPLLKVLLKSKKRIR